MRPYDTIRLIEHPDVADLRMEARPTRMGRMDGRSIFRRPRVKRATRRHLKHADRARSMRAELKMEAECEWQDVLELIHIEEHLFGSTEQDRNDYLHWEAERQMLRDHDYEDHYDDGEWPYAEGGAL